MTEKYREQEHNYEIYYFGDGIRISPREIERPPVDVTITKKGFWSVESEEHKHEFPMFRYYDLFRGIVEELYETWSPPDKHINQELEMSMAFKNANNKFFDYTDEERKYSEKQRRIIEWCKFETRKSLSKKLKRMLDVIRDEQVDADIIALHKKMYSVSGGAGNWYNIEKILKHKNSDFIIKDALRFRAYRSILLYIQGEALESILSVKNWRNWLSPTGKAYGALTKTLTYGSQGIPHYYYRYLDSIILPEVCTTKLRLYAYVACACGREYNPLYKYGNRFVEVILRSTDEEIRQALMLIYGEWHPDKPRHFDMRRNRLITNIFNYIFDYPDEDFGKLNMVGLAKRSIAYHNENAYQRALRQAKQDEKLKEIVKSETALPPIPLPVDPCITFLNSYREVCDEGILMNHCISTYASRAVKGNCYLFHVDYNGEMASVEVTTGGMIRQSYGPHDTSNIASQYGREVLSNWGKQLSELGFPKTFPIIRMGTLEKEEEDEMYEEEEIHLEGMQMMQPVFDEALPF